MSVHASAALYLPASGMWISAGTMLISRTDHTASLLLNGKVLIAGGQNGSPFASTEVYDPAFNTWIPASSMQEARSYHVARELLDGKVLVAGGFGNSGRAFKCRVV